MEYNFNFQEKATRGRKPQLFMVLDCETATLPFANELCKSAKDKQKIAIAKPLVYDLGWQVVDRQGNVYSRHSILIQETFFTPNIFNTAYYREKRPMYMQKLEKGEMVVMNWNDAIDILISDIERCEFISAYNSMFDFKKAIPYTDEYILHLYSADYQKWEDNQKGVCKAILSDKKWENPDEFDNMNFNFRNNDYPIACLWGLACTKLINQDEYRLKCLEHSMISPSGLFFKTSAETTYRFILSDYEYTEEHTALEDTFIETEILLLCFKKGKIDLGITYFPFRELGETYDFIINSNNLAKLDIIMIQNVLDTMEEKLREYTQFSSFATQLEYKIQKLERVAQRYFDKPKSHLFNETSVRMLTKKIRKMYIQQINLKPNGDAWNRLEREIERLAKDIKGFDDYEITIKEMMEDENVVKNQWLIDKILQLFEIEGAKEPREFIVEYTVITTEKEVEYFSEEDIREYFDYHDKAITQDMIDEYTDFLISQINLELPCNKYSDDYKMEEL